MFGQRSSDFSGVSSDVLDTFRGQKNNVFFGESFTKPDRRGLQNLLFADNPAPSSHDSSRRGAGFPLKLGGESADSEAVSADKNASSPGVNATFLP